MLKKFVGDKMSIEASSHDGKRWEVRFFDRGRLTTYSDATTTDLDKMVAEKRMRPAPLKI